MQKLKVRLRACASRLAIGASVAALIATAAAAQDSLQVEEVVVTARRTEENVQKIPLAVTAHSGAQINELVVNSVQDLNKLAPGLQVTASSGTRNTNQPSIRGQGTSFGTNQNSVIGYFAEAPNFRASVMDLASVQVVKGPQGTLFGATATGGVILYEPNRPEQDELNGYVSLQLGDYSYKNLEVALGGAIVPEKLLVRGAFKIRRRDGFTTAVQSWGGVSDYDNIDSDEWRLAVTWRPTDSFENYLMYAGASFSSHGEGSPLGYVDNRFMNPAVRNIPLSFVPTLANAYLFETGVAPTPGLSFAQLQSAAWTRQITAGPRTMFVNYNHANDHRFDGVVNQTRLDVTDDITIKNVLGVSWQKDRGPAIEIDGSDVPLVDTRAPMTRGTTNLYDPDYAWVGGWPSRKVTEELQIQGRSFDDRLNWQLGAYGSWEGDREFRPNSTIWVFTSLASSPDPANGAVVSQNGQVLCRPTPTATPTQCLSTMTKNASTDKAIYGQATFAVTEDFHATVGLRHSWATREVTTGFTPTYFFMFNGQPFPIPVTDRDVLPGTESTLSNPTEERNTYTLAADWQATDDLLLYATTRSGYKPGGINSNAPADNPNRQFGPETLTDIELGAKLDWRLGGLRGRSNLALFQDKYSDIQTSSIIPGTATTVTVNAAEATIQGAEFESTVIFTDWFEVSGWYAYLDASYDNFVQTQGCSSASNYWYPQCAAATGGSVTINKATGAVIVAPNNGPAVTYQGRPETFNNSAEHTFSLQPKVRLEPWLGQDISMTANIQYRSSQYLPNLDYPGITLAPGPAGSGVPAKGPFYSPSRVTVDAHIDWKNVMGSKLDLSLVGTNLTDETYNIANSGGFTIMGGFEYIYSEPRTVYLELRYPFGG